MRERQLNHSNIASFLKINGHYATESELTAIVRRLDIDADQKIRFDEFIEAFSSSQPAEYRSPSKYEELKERTSPLRDC